MTEVDIKLTPDLVTSTKDLIGDRVTAIPPGGTTRAMEVPSLQWLTAHLVYNGRIHYEIAEHAVPYHFHLPFPCPFQKCPHIS